MRCCIDMHRPYHTQQRDTVSMLLEITVNMTVEGLTGGCVAPFPAVGERSRGKKTR
jgi:hypothetical protein